MIGSVFHIAGDGNDARYAAYLSRPIMTHGNETLTATANDDIVVTGRGRDVIEGGGGNDIIAGVRFNFSFGNHGGEVVDTDGNAGHAFAVQGGDTLLGGGGDDVIFAGYDTRVDGGSGIDTAHLDFTIAWVPWVAGTILTTFNERALNVDLGAAASGSVGLQVGGLGDMVTTVSNVERFEIYLGRGADSVTGGAFDDTIYGGAGSDTADDVLRGAGGDDLIEGQGGADMLYGDAGNDVLRSGATGAGFEDYAVDQLFGGEGDDFLLANARDRFDGGAGFDTAEISFWRSATAQTINMSKLFSQNTPYVLADGTSFVGLEAVSLLRLGDANDKVTGSSRDDVVFGEGGNDNLTGADGTDQLNGGDGNDKLNGGDGADTVSGGGGNDIVDGGAGADQLIGWTGDDTYIVDNAQDVIVLEVSGVDTVKASVSYTLIADVEKLILTKSAAIDGTGSNLANTLTGNGAANRLFGLGGEDSLSGGGGADRLHGGAGADTLTGGAGADWFVFDTAPAAGERDQVKDFKPIDDTLGFSSAVFAALTAAGGGNAGQLDPAQLRIGAAAADADERLIYNPTTGVLFYDADGSGAGAAIEVALMAKNLALSAADFQLLG